MKYMKVTTIQGFDVSGLSDDEIRVLTQSLEEEKERREALEVEQYIREFTDKLNDFISTLHDRGLVLAYNGYEIDINDFDIDVDDE